MTVLDEVLATVFYIVSKWHGCRMRFLAMFINDAHFVEIVM